MMNTPIKIVLGCDLDKKAVTYIKDFLLLDDTAVKDLKTSGKGQGIIKIGDTHAPIHFAPSDEEHKIIKGFYTGNNQENISENIKQSPEGKIKDEYVNIVKDNKIVFSDWIEGEDTAYQLQKMGYKYFKPQNILSAGFIPCWIHSDIVKDDEYVKNQTIDHYSSVMQLYGILHKKKATCKFLEENEITVNHADDVDVSIGNMVGFEYEHADSHNLQEIIEKKQRGLLKYKYVFFIGSKANETILIEGAGKDFVIRRGKQLSSWLDEHFNESFDFRAFGFQENDLNFSEELLNEAV
jgi:hypothetical protein